MTNASVFTKTTAAFLALGSLSLVTSTFTLATCVRDALETAGRSSRLDQARVEADPRRARPGPRGRLTPEGSHGTRSPS